MFKYLILALLISTAICTENGPIRDDALPENYYPVMVGVIAFISFVFGIGMIGEVWYMKGMKKHINNRNLLSTDQVNYM